MSEGRVSCEENLDALLNELKPIFTHPEKLYWVSVDFRTLLRATHWHFKDAENLCNRFLSKLLDLVGNDQTILISAFNLDFPSTQRFDVATAPIMTGAFNNFILQQHPLNRTAQPFYSFMAFGAREKEITALQFPNTSGKESIMGWLVNQECQLVTVGHHYVKSLSHVHHVEECVDVDYRYRKLFSGEIHHLGKSYAKEVSFYVRDLDTCDFSSLTVKGDSACRDANIVHTNIITDIRHPLLVHSLCLNKTHNLLVDNLKNGTELYVDYFGPHKPNGGVITSAVADKLYFEELKNKI